MVPLIFNLGPTELLIILAIVLLLFGGSRLAGLGKSSGRALKEFKEETRGLKQDTPKPTNEQPPAVTAGPDVNDEWDQPPRETTTGATEPEPRRDV